MYKILSLQKYVHIKLSMLWLLISVVICSQASAESLPDPTRPFSAAVPAIAQAGPVLQSVLITPSQQVAIINGERIAVGEHYDGTRLMSLTDGEAVLKGKDGLQKLTLFPRNKKYDITWNKRRSNDIPILNSYIVHRR